MRSFGRNRNKQLIEEKLRPCLSHQALLTQQSEITPSLAKYVLPHVKSCQKLGNESKWLNDTLEDALKILNTSNSLSLNQTKISENEARVPEVQDSIHVFKNHGDFYVQKCLSKSIYFSTTSGMQKQNHKDLIKARDIFYDDDGHLNTRAAKEGTLKNLNKSTMHLLTHKAKIRRNKRNKSLK
mmetsp:Transcript_16000/g.13979  ORF Transcript_16000/g.13979 Transcript_16000/m.13979 type:complete len:183 (-) Transcript_16000:131-679(-)